MTGYDANGAPSERAVEFDSISPAFGAALRAALRAALAAKDAEIERLRAQLAAATAALESVRAEREAAWAVAEVASLWDVCDEAEDDMAAIEAIDELKEVLRPWRELRAAKSAAIDAVCAQGGGEGQP